jgi:hypothetical protein
MYALEYCAEATMNLYTSSSHIVIVQYAAYASAFAVPWAATRSLLDWYKTVRPTCSHFGILRHALNASRHCLQGAAFAAIGAALITLIDAAHAYATRKQWTGFRLQNAMSVDITQNIARGIAETALIGATLTVAPYSFAPVMAVLALRMCHLPWQNSEEFMYAIHDESSSSDE